MAPHSSRFHSCNLPVNSCAGPEHIIVTYFYLHRVVTGSLESTATTSFIVADAFHSAYFEPRELPYPFVLPEYHSSRLTSFSPRLSRSPGLSAERWQLPTAYEPRLPVAYQPL